MATKGPGITGVVIAVGVAGCSAAGGSALPCAHAGHQPADNTAQTTYTYDGANRQLTVADPLNNVTTNVYDANGNTVQSTRAEACTISGVTTIESFITFARYDVLNRTVITGSQGADGVFTDTIVVSAS